MTIQMAVWLPFLSCQKENMTATPSMPSCHGRDLRPSVDRRSCCRWPPWHQSSWEDAWPSRQHVPGELSWVDEWDSCPMNAALISINAILRIWGCWVLGCSPIVLGFRQWRFWLLERLLFHVTWRLRGNLMEQQMPQVRRLGQFYSAAALSSLHLSWKFGLLGFKILHWRALCQESSIPCGFLSLLLLFGSEVPALVRMSHLAFVDSWM